MQINYLLLQAFLVAVWLLSEVESQDVISCTKLDNPRVCTTGLVSNQDVVTVACTLNKTGVVNPERAKLFAISQSNEEKLLCQVGLQLCPGTERVNCNCRDTGDTYIVYYNTTADIFVSEGEIKLTWYNDAETAEIQAVEDPTLEECTLNGHSIPKNSNFSNFEIEIKDGSNVIYKCSSALSPVETSISYKNVSAGGGSSAVIDGSQSGEGVYTFSSKICGIPAHSGSCKAVLRAPETSTVSTTTVIQTTEGPKELCDETCIIIIVVVVVVVVAGVAVAAGIIYFKKYKKSSGRQLTPRRSLENKHTSEVETTHQGDDYRNDHTNTSAGTLGNVQKRSKNAHEKLNDLDCGDKQHESYVTPRRLPPLNGNKQLKDANRTMISSGSDVQPPETSHHTSIELTAGSRPLPQPTMKPK